MQIPGVHYKESFSPVNTATTLQTGIEITLYFDGEICICELVDLGAELLEGKLKTKLYINLPKGMVDLGFIN